VYILLIIMKSNNKKFNMKKAGESSNCACFNLRKITRVVTQVFEDVFRHEGIDLKGTQYSLLVNVFAYGPIPITRLSEILVMDRTSLARNLKPLLNKGYLKINNGEDKRIKMVELTPAGKQILSNAYPYWKSTQKSVVKEIGEKNWKLMFESINSFVPKFESIM